MAGRRFGLTSHPTLSALFAVAVAGGGIAAVVTLPTRPAPAAESSALSTAIVVAGQPFDVGRPVVLWKDPQGFDAYQVRCIDQRGGCCDSDSKRYGSRKMEHDTVEDMQQQVSRSWCCTSTAA